MGFRAIVSPDDLKVGELIEPGYHAMVLADYKEKEASTDKSVNAFFTFKIVDGPYKGYSARAMFNEKAMGMGKKLWAALGIPFDKETGYSLSSEVFERIASTHPVLKVYIKRGKSNTGNEFNDPSDFMPMS